MLRSTIFLMLFVCTSLAEAATTSSITQYNITWNFQNLVEYGQFANGDYWIVDPGGGVVLTLITNSFHPGTEWNVVDYDGTTIDCNRSSATPTPPQGWDRYLANYSSELNVNHHLPYTVTSGHSVLSAISWLAEDVGTSYDVQYNRYRPKLKRISILTVLADNPGPNAMRPSYASGQKKIYSALDIDESKFPDLPVTTSHPTLDLANSRIQGPWVDLWHEYTSEFGRPSENFKSMPIDNLGTYQAYILPYYTQAVLLACLDEAVVGDKTGLIVRIAQIGIDYYGLLKNGSTWPANGGHQLGYKLPILVAGLLFNDNEMLNVGKQYAASSNTFQEDCNHFYIDQRAVDISNGPTWTPDTRAVLTPYTVQDIGKPEWGIRHCSKPSSDNADITATYRGINGPPDMGYGLAAMILGLRGAWNHEPFFDYLDRWYTWSGAFSSSFERQMWETYRSNYTITHTGDEKSNGLYHFEGEILKLSGD